MERKKHKVEPRLEKKSPLRFIPLVFYCLILVCVVSMYGVFHSRHMYFKIEQESMYPTFNSNQSGLSDAVYVLKNAEYDVGDIVVAEKQEEYFVVKRVIALGGDKIGFKLGFDENQKQTYTLVRIVSGTSSYYEMQEIYQNNYYDNKSTYDSFVNLFSNDNFEVIDGIKFLCLSQNEVFCLGDNRDESQDCADYGPFTKKQIVGKVDIVVKEEKNALFSIIAYKLGIKKII